MTSLLPALILLASGLRQQPEDVTLRRLQESLRQQSESKSRDIEAYAARKDAPEGIAPLLELLQEKAPNLDADVCQTIRAILSKHLKATCPLDPLLEVLRRRIWTSQYYGALLVAQILRDDAVWKGQEAKLNDALFPLLTSPRDLIVGAAMRSIIKINGPKPYDTKGWILFYHQTTGKTVDRRKAIYESVVTLLVTAREPYSYRLNRFDDAKDEKELVQRLASYQEAAQKADLPLEIIIQTWQRPRDDRGEYTPNIRKTIQLLTDYNSRSGFPPMTWSVAEPPKPDPKIEQCRKNLAELAKLVPGYVEFRKDQSGKGGNPEGREFWSRLAQHRPSLQNCPMSNTPYRGPRGEIGRDGKDVNYLACCEPGGHPDGWIHALDCNGRILALKPGAAEFRPALECTRGNFSSDLDEFFEAELRVRRYRQEDPARAISNLRSMKPFLQEHPELKLGDPADLDPQIADLSKQQSVPNPLFDSWKNFRAGSWVKLKVETIEDGEKTVTEETETLVSATAEMMVVQRKTLSTLGGQPFTSTDQEDIPASTASILKVEKGKDEEIEVAGKKVACRVLLVTKAAKESVGEIRHKFWMKDDVPGGVVRSESVAVRQNRVVATAVALGWEKK
jgi:hypothetical protein